MAKKNRLKPKDFFHKVIVIDNSVLMKPFLNEEGAAEVRELFKMAYQKEMTVLAPTLIVFEFLNAAAKSMEDADEVEVAFKKFKKLDIGLLNPDDKYVKDAARSVCEERDISYYDASYHALALDMDAIFLTADKKYFDLMKHKGNIALFV